MNKFKVNYRAISKWIFLLMLVPILAYGPTEIGSGTGDEDWKRDLAWFAEWNRPVRYCFTVDSEFGTSTDEAHLAIQEAFEGWKNYFQKKRITVSGEVKAFYLSTKIQHHKICDGSEDLHFYFGGNNPLITKYKTQFINPVAFATRTYVESPSWAKGIIWVAKSKSIHSAFKYPDWETKGNLATALMHELGHTYGNSHYEGTVMQANLWPILTNQDPRFKKRIDILRELIVCKDCMQEASASLTPTRVDIFELFSGRKGRGAGKVFLKRRSGTTEWGAISFSDEAGTLTYARENPGALFEQYLIAPPSNLQFFYAAPKEWRNPIAQYNHESQSFLSLPTKNPGEKVLLIIDDNQALAYLRLTIVLNGTRVPLAWFPKPYELPN